MTASSASLLSDAQAYDIAAKVLARPECQGLVSAGLDELLLALLQVGFEPSGTFPVAIGEAYRGCAQVAAVMAYDPVRRASLEVRCVLYVHTVETSRSQAQLYLEAVAHDAGRVTGSVNLGRRLAQVDLNELPPTLAAQRRDWDALNFERAILGAVRTLSEPPTSQPFKDAAHALVATLEDALAP